VGMGARWNCPKSPAGSEVDAGRPKSHPLEYPLEKSLPLTRPEIGSYSIDETSADGDFRTENSTGVNRYNIVIKRRVRVL